jgi:hypothetical protein
MKWLDITPTTSVMKVPGGMVLRETQSLDYQACPAALCFVPWPSETYVRRVGAESPDAAMRWWIEQATAKEVA